MHKCLSFAKVFLVKKLYFFYLIGEHKHSLFLGLV